MNYRRQLFLTTLWLGISLAVSAHAQTYPTKPVRIVVPYSAGSGTDITTRIVGDQLSKILGQQIVVEDKPGANGIIGTDAVAKSPSDGYTLIMVASNHVVNASLYRKLPYDPIKDFAPISIIDAVPFILAVSLQTPAHSVHELIALAKSEPGKLTYGSAGNGSPPHLAAELMKSMAHIKMLHVPYKGVAAEVNALMGDQINVGFGAIATMLPHAKAHQVRALAVTSLSRSPATPDIPTMAESGLPGFEVVSWIGLLAPAGVPKDILDKLSAAAIKVVHMPEVRKRLMAKGAYMIGSTQEEFSKTLHSDMAKWAKVVKESGARID